MTKIKISDIEINSAYRMDNNNDLKESIEKCGLMNPILVRKIKDNKYELIDGYARIQACKELKQKEIEANILVECDSKEVLMYRLLKSILSHFISDKECGRYIIGIMKQTGITIEELAKRMERTVEEIQSYIKAAKE